LPIALAIHICVDPVFELRVIGLKAPLGYIIGFVFRVMAWRGDGLVL
jgi:hypothetical protein